MKRWIGFIFTSFSILFLSACGTSEESSSSDMNEENEQEEQSAGEFPIEVTDGRGEEVSIDEKPERIVSLVPSNTEIAFALGLGDEIVGVTDYCNYPEEATEKQSVGDMDFDVETLLSLEPDLVLAHASSAHGSEEGLKQIEEAGIDVLIVNDASSFEDAYGSIEMIAQATGTEEEAETIISDMKEDIIEIEEQAESITEDERKTVWVEIQPPPEIFTTGQGTFINEMLETINAENAAGEEEGWIQYSEEEAVALNPEVIITTYGHYVDDPSAEIKERAGWEQVPAIENDDIHDIDNDTVSRPGPRLTEGTEQLAELVYPDEFSN
ncbi:ABC transporter substrate-binding protein [Alteribacillus bidgolensis]|uniref:Iron complex transport system substrate-binding protein n=1 Tax=Alteribacillus bidgolensis TaxID=930129 RepID=A0A1G8BZR9_9BACI|nr:ABC transporter substrate-binding protein [Alteribacillus bidgolensis]SDH38625.1 iron complex transport system substrate-binding protein [Alteribacillus bidgolensis]